MLSALQEKGTHKNPATPEAGGSKEERPEEVDEATAAGAEAESTLVDGDNQADESQEAEEEENKEDDPNVCVNWRDKAFSGVAAGSAKFWFWFDGLESKAFLEKPKEKQGYNFETVRQLEKMNAECESLWPFFEFDLFAMQWRGLKHRCPKLVAHISYIYIYIYECPSTS